MSNMLSKETGVALGVVLAAVASAFAVGKWTSSTESAPAAAISKLQSEQALSFQRMESNIAALSLKLQTMESSMSSYRQEAWSSQSHAAWAARFQLLNPNCRVPDPMNGNRPFDVAATQAPPR